ncbi:fimbria/pilus periplasmic chaperone [Citrobacter rodentium NBRC 105723 = DSM 16636]|jgi:P pilus assembly protein, chaperone PapD|uniref:Molecular chaperone FimC n=2 Tax=Citrobacter rodentium TaxID=67825 RepID=A0A482PMU3_CITRO|nr:fimbria/pilus periplasmic chaperone [Citrobacter rodentium]QBY29369.1 molecular chaperone FimC [Citrobacter rodentium]UHO33229.1 fimbria/pilus periplasmic chaperone [Citrobacter rodentium NBRC 105723 = DSM 16636]HAT8015157.1 molecular chaperone FimC [Citrobacter rodentium NBRC 105723 = DSM 16636]HAT8017496.1 molecular chaperone FimC [Citrobacter rodentium]HAT8029775.1 molecular chaperone FimC [Citrobacter rodentium]
MTVKTSGVIMKKTRAITSCLLTGVLMLAASGLISQAKAGVALGATRVIYPAGQKQVQLAVTNNDDNSTYLIQSWVENADGVKDNRFVVTPPLFAMQGKKENTLRILDATNNQLPQDRESLFWMNVKAIPSMDKSKLSENTLQLAIISRIKLYYRPAGLPIPPDSAAEKLKFRRSTDALTLINPTPYYLTVTELTAGNRSLENALVPPLGEARVKLPAGASGEITYKTINDYGALTPRMKGAME